MTLFKRHITPFQLAVAGISFLALLIFLQVMLFTAQKRQAETADAWVVHTFSVIDKIEDVFSKVKDIELGQRGYVLTGQTRFLDPYKAALGLSMEESAYADMGYLDDHSLLETLQEINELTKDNAPQQAHLKQLEALIQEQLAYVEHTIGVHDQKGAAAAQAITRQGRGKQLMDAIRKQVSVMARAEKALLRERTEYNQTLDKRFSMFIAAAAFFTYCSLFVTILLVVANFARARRMEKELFEKETFFRAAAEASTDPFFLYRVEKDAAGNISDLKLQFVNPAAERTIEQPLRDVLDKSVEEVFRNHPMPLEELKQAYIDAIRRNTAYKSEFSVMAGRMKGHCFSEDAVPFSDGISVSFRDITERKNMERMKSEFVSTVSHELRTPLTSIRGSLGLIAGGVTGEISAQAKSLVTIAHSNCERLVRLINDILDIEKIESGKMTFDTKPMEILPIIQQSIQANQSFATKYQAHIVLVENNIPKELRVVADADRTIQVLTNLLSNAAKYSPANGSITVGLTQTANHLRVEVRDQGNGIPLEFQSRIFQKFAQADSSDTRQKGGTGLGLNIVKAIVEEMGGEVGFTSEPGKGTMFYFTLPLAPYVASSEHAALSDSLISANAQAALSRILVCEDEPDIANLLGMILERAGFAVDYARTAKEALELLEQRYYLAMTLDLMLPDKCGISFIQELREMPCFYDLPIIVVSAKAEKGKTLLNGDAVGVVDWMSKPIDMDKLVSLVRGLYMPPDRAHILHVEDDLDIAQVIRLSLKDVADCDHAVSLLQARECLGRSLYDLVVLDIGLPDGQGTDLLPILRGDRHKTTPVVLFTAGEIPPDLGSQVTAALVKSRTSEDKLLETIQRLIEQKPLSIR